MYTKETAYIATFLLLSQSGVMAATIDLSSPTNQDPWLIYYNRFSTNHPECSPAAGSLLISPDYTRMLVFYDDTQKEPMILSPNNIENDAYFSVFNKSCSLKIIISRKLGWDVEARSAPAKVSENENLKRVENPAMVAEIHYNDTNVSCTQFEIPFFLNRNNISFTISNSFRSGYKISTKSQQDGDFIDNTFSKPGCEVKIHLELKVNVDGVWINNNFRH